MILALGSACGGADSGQVMAPAEVTTASLKMELSKATDCRRAKVTGEGSDGPNFSLIDGYRGSRGRLRAR